MKRIIPLEGQNPLEVLYDCGGYYHQHPQPDGSFKGPLVAYAGKYTSPTGEELQRVGRVYCNFAKIECHATALRWVTRGIVDEAKKRGIDFYDFTGFCGAPEGGKALAVSLQLLFNSHYIFPEKKEIAPETSGGRAKSKLVWGRHEPSPHERWVMVEDTSNNFSTPDELGTLIEEKGAEPAAMVCFLNRSIGESAVEETFTMKSGRTIPVIALVRKPMDQFRQDDPAVKDQIAEGNVVWSVKKDWHKIEPFTERFIPPV